MKRLNKLTALITAVGAATALSSCGSLWTSASVGVGDPGYYDSGIYSTYYPTPPESPFISPIFWGSQLYPTQPQPPAIRPTRPGASIMYPGNMRPSGNTRPSAATPATQPDAIPVPTGSNSSHGVIPPAGTFNPSNTTGGQPGIVIPGRH